MTKCDRERCCVVTSNMTGQWQRGWSHTLASWGVSESLRLLVSGTTSHATCPLLGMASEAPPVCEPDAEQCARPCCVPHLEPERSAKCSTMTRSCCSQPLQEKGREERGRQTRPPTWGLKMASLTALSSGSLKGPVGLMVRQRQGSQMNRSWSLR